MWYPLKCRWVALLEAVVQLDSNLIATTCVLVPNCFCLPQITQRPVQFLSFYVFRQGYEGQVGMYTTKGSVLCATVHTVGVESEREQQAFLASIVGGM